MSAHRQTTLQNLQCQYKAHKVEIVVASRHGRPIAIAMRLVPTFLGQKLVPLWQNWLQSISALVTTGLSQGSALAPYVADALNDRLVPGGSQTFRQLVREAFVQIGRCCLSRNEQHALGLTDSSPLLFASATRPPGRVRFKYKGHQVILEIGLDSGHRVVSVSLAEGTSPLCLARDSLSLICALMSLMLKEQIPLETILKHLSDKSVVDSLRLNPLARDVLREMVRHLGKRLLPAETHQELGILSRAEYRRATAITV